MNYPFLYPILFIWILFSCDKNNHHITPDNPLNTIRTVAELTNALNDIYDGSEAAGFAVSVVKNDILLYQQSFGSASIESNKAYTNQTTQPIGSISKTFVAAAIVKAIDQGHFTLETDINNILPIKIINPKQPNSVIKVKHLVTHTSGLLDKDEAYLQAYHILPGENLSTKGSQLLMNGLGIQQRKSVPLEKFLAEYYLEGGELYTKENFSSNPPGSTWNYSNIATSLAAYLVEVATGSPFNEYVLTQILQPLDMTNTAYELSELKPSYISKLYWDKNTSLPHYSNDSYPDGSINTCNEDLAKYLMDMMKGAKGQSTTLFSTEAYKRLFDPLLPNDIIRAGIGKNQGVFWFLDRSEIKHDGSDPGTTCNIQFDKTGNAGYLLLTNMDASTEEHTTDYLNLAGKVHNVIAEFMENN